VLLATFYLVTLAYDQTGEEVTALLAGLGSLEEELLFTYLNADTAGRVIIESVTEFCEHNELARVVVIAGQEWCVSLLGWVDGMVGILSSGIIKATTFGLSVVKIGTRQEGHIRGRNVVDCARAKEEIVGVIRKIRSPGVRQSLAGFVNLYGDERTSKKMACRFEQVEIDRCLTMKRFVDQQFAKPGLAPKVTGGLEGMP
jgi:hypothetical protein